MTRLELAFEQIVFARNYTIELLDQTPVAEWFRQPPGGVSHDPAESVVAEDVEKAVQSGLRLLDQLASLPEFLQRINRA